jgi:presenilin-like A22 family membrane protease
MKTAFTIVAIFLVTQLIGLYVGTQYLAIVEAGEMDPVFEDPNAIENSLMLFVYIIVFTIAILLLVKFWKPSIRVLEALVVFMSSWVTFEFLIPITVPVGGLYFSLGFFLAIALTAWKALRPTILNQDIAAMISGAGAGALLGASFGVVPSLVFLLLLVVYDFVSVFITKHMIHLAKELTKTPLAFTIASPHKFKRPKYFKVRGKRKMKRVHVFHLGVGDIVIPLMFSISLLRSYTILNSLMTIIGSTIALTLMIYYISKKPRALPALPFISVGTLLAFVFSLLI